MGDVQSTVIGRIGDWFWQKRYDFGMWLVVRCIYPDADPKDFQLLDTKYFIAVELNDASPEM